MSESVSGWRRAGTAVLLAAGSGGCNGFASALDPAGPQAERISRLTWFLFSMGTAVFLIVVSFLVYSLWRGSQRTEIAASPDVERKMTRAVLIGVGTTVTILLVLLVLDFSTGRALANFGRDDALTVRVTGHQWWWEVVYDDPSAHRQVTTANEIYIPVGRRIRLLGNSRDVIHSFWAPNLHGKVDLIPTRERVSYFQADRPGVYRGRCAEFCGLEHARMDFRVIAVPADSFARWYERELQPAALPTDSLQALGQQVFLSNPCVLCHTVRGTPAGSRVGPDLTHLASRSTLGAGTLPNTRGHLAGWVLDPQKIKPGVKMPPNQLSSAELHALLSYLESLK